MLSTLIASLGLALSCATPIIETPYCAYSGQQISFSYAIRHVNDSNAYYTEPLFNEDVEIDFNEITGAFSYGISTNNEYFVCNINEYHDFYGTFEGVDRFIISYNASTNITTFNVGYYDLGTTFTCAIGDTFQDINTIGSADYLEYLAVAFPRAYYLTDNQKFLFDTFFDRGSNPHFIYYTGWYSFANRFTGTTGFKTNLISNLTYNNDLYGRIEIDAYDNTHTYDVFFYYGTNTGDFNTGIKRVYFNSVMMSDIDLSRMLQVGSFGFMPSSQEYTLTDLFFDIGDTPVVFITSLFDFELFGVNFSIAFMGIITLIAMIFILKKVV